MDLLTWLRNQWDRVSAWVLVSVGGIALVLGWIGVTGTPYTFEQIPYVISGGLGGVFLLGVGAMLWISADLRDEWRKLDRLLELHEQRAETDATRVSGDPLAAEATANGPAQPSANGADRAAAARRKRAPRTGASS